jgi:hypothetical protein
MLVLWYIINKPIFVFIIRFIYTNIRDLTVRQLSLLLEEIRWHEAPDEVAV